MEYLSELYHKVMGGNYQRVPAETTDKQLIPSQTKLKSLEEACLLVKNCAATIKHLDLSNLQLHDDDILRLCQFLQDYPQIISLSVVGNPITDTSATHLGTLPLTNLDISATNIRDPGLKILTQNQTLTSLTAKQNRITTLGAQEAFSGNQHLVHLNLAGNQICGVGVRAIADISSLRTVSLNANGLTDDDVSVLATNLNLQKVALRFNPAITNQGIMAFQRHALSSLDTQGSKVDDSTRQLVLGSPCSPLRQNSKFKQVSQNYATSNETLASICRMS